jgi:tRNA pseudouridine38-40 synthase
MDVDPAPSLKRSPGPPSPPDSKRTRVDEPALETGASAHPATEPSEGPADGKEKRHTRGDKRGKLRRGTKGTSPSRRAIGGRRSTRAEGPLNEGEEVEKAPRLPKRQCALLLGFAGTGYSGMQM